MAINTTFVGVFSTLHIAEGELIGDRTAMQIRNLFTPSSATKFQTNTGAAKDVVLSVETGTEGGSYMSYFKVISAITGTGQAVDGTLEQAFALITSGKLSLLTTEVPFVKSIGNLSAEANIVELSIMGDDYKQKLRGQLNVPNQDNELIWIPGNPIHNYLLERNESGNPLLVGTLWKKASSSLAVDTHLAIYNSQISKFDIATQGEDATMATISNTVSGKIYYATGG